MRLPPFWRENPAFWFAQVEAGFALSRITSDDSRFRYVILNLDTTVLPFITDLVTTPPTQNKYDAIKARIISSFDESSESKLRRLLQGVEHGDQKPSHYLQRLRNLAAGQCADTVIRALFLERLPDTVRGILAANETADLAQLATQADKIIDFTKSAAHVNTVAVSYPAPQQEPPSEVAELRRRVDELTRQIQRSRVSDHRARQRSRSRGRDKSSRRSPKAICYYHSTFGTETKCRQPCGWPSISASPEN